MDEFVARVKGKRIRLNVFSWKNHYAVFTRITGEKQFQADVTNTISELTLKDQDWGLYNGVVYEPNVNFSNLGWFIIDELDDLDRSIESRIREIVK